MSSSGNPPMPSLLSDHHHQQRRPLMSFKSSVGSKPLPSRLIEGSAGPAAARVDLLMKSAIGSGAGGISPAGYYADVAGTLGSSWISRLRRPSPQPPPPNPAQGAPSTATTGQSVGTEGSGVAGGTREPLAPPSSSRPVPVPYVKSAYHARRLCLNALGAEENLHSRTHPQLQPPPPCRQVAATGCVRGFGPFRFSDVPGKQNGNGIQANRPAMLPDRDRPLPLRFHTQQSQSQRTTPVPKPWNLAADLAEAGCVKARPSGFFPLFATIVRGGEEVQGGAPKTAPPCPAEGSDLKPPLLRCRQLRSSGAEKDTFSERLTPQHSGQSHNRLFPLQLPTSSGEASTVRLSCGGGGTSSTAFLSRRSNERLVDLNPASPSQSLTHAVFPAGGDRCGGIPAFGFSMGPVAAAAKASLPADLWRHSSALLGNAEDDSQLHQVSHKDATAIPNNRSFLASSNSSGPAPPCGSEDRLSFWNMGRFWPTGSSLESLSRKRLFAPDGVVSPLKCRKLGNQG